jgi:putative Mn2+ efflux pump MntP
MFGVFLALAGVIGLLAVFAVLSHKVAAIIGSILLILAGLQTIMRSKCKCCNAA